MKRLILMCLVLLCTAASASDHRESPAIQGDPHCDLTDFYAFLNPRDSSKLVLVMAVNPFQTTVQEGTYHFTPDARYRFNIDNNGDAIADHVIDVSFGAYNTATHKQAYTARISNDISVTGVVTEGTRITHEPNPPVITDGPQGIRTFAGTRDDPFFIDTVGVQRTFAGTGRFTATDALAGYNVSAIVIELPVSMVTGARGTKLGMWASVDRKNNSRSQQAEAELAVNGERGDKFHQIQRLGNPAIKVIFVPEELKDLYNATKPHEKVAMWTNVLVNSLRGPQFSLKESEVQRLAGLFAPDVLHLDLAKPVKFPNGRWLDDDAIDIIFTSNLDTDLPILYRRGELDGVNHNDVPFSNDFPYLAPPHQAP